MFIKKWQLMFLYIGRIGLGSRAFDRHSRNEGQGIANKTCPQGQAFDICFFPNARRFPGGLPVEGDVSRLGLTRTLSFTFL